MDISIVIPVLNEQDKIVTDITNAAAFFQKYSLTGEIIIVSDGSEDNTAEAARSTGYKEVHVIEYTPTRGKGYAIRKGMQNSQGDYALFIDSGNTIPYENVARGLCMIQNNECDIAHSSRFLPSSHIVKPHILPRRITSFLFRKILLLFMGLPAHFTDTQCGLKIYRGDIARELYSECITDGFMLDIEVILRALRRGYQIKEFPIDWTADPDSRLSMSRTPLNMLKELLRIKRALAGCR
jgi:dolichyl-phosphate beta-glucosyltransferase